MEMGTSGRWGNPPSRGRKKKRLHTILQPRGADVRFLEVVFAFEIKEFEKRRPKLTSRERWKINSRVHIYLFMCYAVLGYARTRWLNTLYGIVWDTKYGRSTPLTIPKYEHFTLLVCPLRCLVISAMRELRNVRSFKTCMFRFWALCHEREPG